MCGNSSEKKPVHPSLDTFDASVTSFKQFKATLRI